MGLRRFTASNGVVVVEEMLVTQLRIHKPNDVNPSGFLNQVAAGVDEARMVAAQGELPPDFIVALNEFLHDQSNNVVKFEKATPDGIKSLRRKVKSPMVGRNESNS